jgi:hypothetical protein
VITHAAIDVDHKADALVIIAKTHRTGSKFHRSPSSLAPTITAQCKGRANTAAAHPFFLKSP